MEQLLKNLKLKCMLSVYDEQLRAAEKRRPLTRSSKNPKAGSSCNRQRYDSRDAVEPRKEKEKKHHP
jgi:hypothetical protein